MRENEKVRDRVEEVKVKRERWRSPLPNSRLREIISLFSVKSGKLKFHSLQ